jgi:hypothetical protein
MSCFEMLAMALLCGTHVNINKSAEWLVVAPGVAVLLIELYCEDTIQ